jgi:hypothetical protein
VLLLPTLYILSSSLARSSMRTSDKKSIVSVQILGFNFSLKSVRNFQNECQVMFLTNLTPVLILFVSSIPPSEFFGNLHFSFNSPIISISYLTFSD